MSLLCCIPLLREKFVSQISARGSDFQAFDISILRKTLAKIISQQELNRIKSVAQSIQEGYSYIFSEPPVRRQPGIFLRHPRTGRRERLCPWPQFRISNQSLDEDIKFLWELNRLGVLDPLMTLAIMEEDRSWCESAGEIIAHWDRDNPVGRGPNWFSNMEVALRLLRFLFAYGIMTQLGRSVPRLREMIHAHYIHVVSDWKATRRTMKGGNHLIVELAALGAYESLSRKQGPGTFWLHAETKRQFLDDGGYFEGSLGYQLYALNVLVFVQLMCMAAKVESPIPRGVVRRAIGFVDKQTGLDGSVPGIGDWDDGNVFKPVQRHPRNVSFLQRFGKAVFGAGETETLEPEKNHWFQSSGMVVRPLKNGLFLFRAAPVVHGHSHLDILAIYYLGAEGPVILDGGTFQYNHSKKSRDSFRSLGAHSTVVPERRWPIQPMGTFRWKGQITPTMEVHANAIHAEYAVEGFGRVCRTVIFEGTRILIHDVYDGEGPCISQFLVPGVKDKDEGRITVLGQDGSEQLRIGSLSRVIFPVVGSVTISNSYGQKEEAVSVQFPFERETEIEIEMF